MHIAYQRMRAKGRTARTGSCKAKATKGDRKSSCRIQSCPDKTEDHKMHAEWGEVTDAAASEIAATRAEGGRVIPVGTTALRLIESAAQDGKLMAWDGPTDIFITPGFQFQLTDALMTNFHLPKSTLMMLVSALMGPERIRAIYDHAISSEYRFFSYGDASILVP